MLILEGTKLGRGVLRGEIALGWENLPFVDLLTSFSLEFRELAEAGAQHCCAKRILAGVVFGR